MVAGGAALAAGVHGPDGRAHIDAAQGEGGGEDVAERGAAGHVAVVDEGLAGHAGTLAERAEDGGRVGVGGVLLRGVVLDDGPSAHGGLVRRVVLLHVVGMEGVGVVGADHK